MKVRLTHSVHPGTIIGASLLLLTAAGGAWWTWQASTSTALDQHPVPVPAVLQPQAAPARSPSVAIPTPVNQPTPSRPQTEELQPESYWLRVNGQQISLVPQQVALNAAVSSDQALMEGVINLLANPRTGDRTSAIPAGTRLLSLRTAPEGIYVDLSREFSQGGGSDSMIYRVAQILYTVTSLDPAAKVYLSVEGQVLDENHPLGGEGLSLKQPLTRQQFAKDFPLS
jgi:spore germination protein GerM